MKSYLDILDNVLSNGHWKESEEVGKVLSLFGETFRHEMVDGFPLVTTNETPIELAWAGLEGLIHGITSSKLGPIDGYQWRRFNQSYDENDDGCLSRYDQLQRIVNALKTDPTDTTLICTSWNPVQLEKMSLKPYRILWNVVVSEDKLNLAWYQRSAEIIRGLPINIALHATLLLLLAETSGLKPGALHGTFADCYIREAHVVGAEKQLERAPRELPIVTLGLDEGSVLQWSRKNATLHNYNPHPRLDFSPILL
jgi:thymidylate synthase